MYATKFNFIHCVLVYDEVENISTLKNFLSRVSLDSYPHHLPGSPVSHENFLTQIPGGGANCFVKWPGAEH